MIKKTLSLILIVSMVLLSGCFVDSNFERIQRINQQEQPLYPYWPIKVFFDEQVYTVVILRNFTVEKAVEYTPDRSVCYTKGLKPVSNIEIKPYLGHTLDQVEDDLGKYHVNIGSGHFMPSYLTKDGYLIIFTVDWQTNIVEHSAKMDLFTGEAIEWYFFNGPESGSPYSEFSS